MNEADQEANTKAIDSLLNYETVKYFGNEEHEARRYDVALQSYETAAVRTRVSLAFLNIGQNAIIAVGVTLLMGMAAMEVYYKNYTPDVIERLLDHPEEAAAFGRRARERAVERYSFASARALLFPLIKRAMARSPA